MHTQLIIFDGECNFCNASVNFIIRRDPAAKFVFTPMQSKLALQLMEKYKLSGRSTDTLLLIKNEQCLKSSTAALEIARQLSGQWYLFLVFKIVPSSIRDMLYNTFARHRYRLFGRRAKCIVPSKEVESRFIGI